jgi:hypothetical protein
MTKLLWVTYKPDLQKLEATVEDEDGKKRRIDYQWQSKEKTPPPESWWKAVCMEVEYQRTEEHNKRVGRFTF